MARIEPCSQVKLDSFIELAKAVSLASLIASCGWIRSVFDLLRRFAVLSSSSCHPVLLPPVSRDSVIDRNAHASCCAFNDFFGFSDVPGVEVGHLRFCNLTDLRARDRGHLSALGEALFSSPAAFLSSSRRRRLQDERERAVLVDGDLDRDDVACLRGRPVVLLAERHDVHAVLAQCRANRRRGSAFPAGSWSLIKVLTFFAIRRLVAVSACMQVGTCHHAAAKYLLHPFYLQEVQLNWSLAAEEGDKHLDLAFSTLISSTEPTKSWNGPSMMRTLADAEADLNLGCGDFHAAQDVLHLHAGRLLVEPPPGATNPVTPGVLRTTYQDSSSMFIWTRRPGRSSWPRFALALADLDFSPSVGTTT